ncbi:MAG TPA: alpha-rhamnosidase, partial [Bacteroidales bacterium]|nr:alpha-rhamnosidase [Bacteroidales bacterium]
MDTCQEINRFKMKPKYIHTLPGFFCISLIFFTIIPEVLIQARQATWIWYPGDYEIWLGNKVQNQRTERGTFFPPFWKMENHYVLVEFSKKLELTTPETVIIKVEGQYNVKLDGKLLQWAPEEIIIPAGKHSLNIKVHNQACVPAIFVQGETFQSDRSWSVTFEDKEWIDESGKASDTSTGTLYVNAGCWNFNSPVNLPSQFRLAIRPVPVNSEKQINNGILYDFGKETFGYLKIHGLIGNGILNIYYGESSDEALSVDHCETLDRLPVENGTQAELTLPGSKAFRYVFIDNDNSLSYDSVSMLYEYLPLEYKGSFRCSDEQIN